VSAYERPRRRRNPVRRRVLWALALVVLFGLGIALGQALEDNPRPASTTTVNRTFTLPPPAATVTVTTP
jgi:hypothetical protein